MKKIKAVVVDDEDSNRSLIIKLISELNPSFEIIAEANSVKRAYDVIKESSPDVIFLDIRMPDGSGFTLLDQFAEINFEVVFVSGFDSYALKAFEFSALDYVLKPIDAQKFSKTLEKVQKSIEKRDTRSPEYWSILQSYDPQQLVITKIPIHNGNKVLLLAIDELTFVKADDGYTQFNTISNQKHYSSKQLSDFEFIFESLPNMIKVNKSIFININYLNSYSKGEPCLLYMKDGTEIEISRRKKREILTLLEGKGK